MNISKYKIEDYFFEAYVNEKGKNILAVKIRGNTMGINKKEELQYTLGKTKDLRKICDKLDELAIDFTVMDEDIESKLYDWP